MQLVVDASVAIAASHSPIGFRPLQAHDLVAPQLLLVEASSVLHEMTWREEITPARARTMLDRIVGASIPAKLLKAAWDLADKMGWAKTYDAQYRPGPPPELQASHSRRALDSRHRAPRHAVRPRDL